MPTDAALCRRSVRIGRKEAEDFFPHRHVPVRALPDPVGVPQVFVGVFRRKEADDPRSSFLRETVIDQFCDGAGADPEELIFETDFSSNRSIWESDLLITDWSGISVEFSYTTERPCVFVNTKIKCLNPEWEKLGITPLEIALRDKICVSLDKDAVKGRIAETVSSMLTKRDEWRSQIAAVRDENVFNPGKCGAVAAEYIIKTLSEKRESAKAKK